LVTEKHDAQTDRFPAENVTELQAVHVFKVELNPNLAVQLVQTALPAAEQVPQLLPAAHGVN